MVTDADVAAVIPSRTVDDSGSVFGTFSWSTVPTAAQVTGIIAQIDAEVTATLGQTPPVGVEALADATIATGAAYLVEMSYYPGAPGGDGGAGLRIRYEAMLRRLAEAVRSLPGESTSHWAFPSYAEPSGINPMIDLIG